MYPPGFTIFCSKENQNQIKTISPPSIFVDHPENKDLQLTDPPKLYRVGSGGYVMDYSIDDNDGTVHKTFILDLKNVKGIEVSHFWPSRIAPLRDGAFVFETYKKRQEDVLLKVQLKR